MKRPNITPGNWKTNLDPEAIADVWQDSTNPRRFVSCAPFCGNVAKMGKKQEREEWAANARAIASVPALLEALETCLTSLAPKTRGALKGYESPEYQKVKAALTAAGYTFD